MCVQIDTDRAKLACVLIPWRHACSTARHRSLTPASRSPFPPATTTTAGGCTLASTATAAPLASSCTSSWTARVSSCKIASLTRASASSCSSVRPVALPFECKGVRHIRSRTSVSLVDAMGQSIGFDRSIDLSIWIE